MRYEHEAQASEPPSDTEKLINQEAAEFPPASIDIGRLKRW
jgi:hypothetical protein